MAEKRPLIERAFELARSGDFEHVTQVIDQLELEGHQDVRMHFAGQTLREQLTMMIVTARTSPS